MTKSSAGAISLFSGAGGLDLGVEDAGARIRLCVEIDSLCVETLKLNRRFFPAAEVVERPLEDISTEELLSEADIGKGEAALLVGGPPCQPFSKAAYWLQTRRKGLHDPRAKLLLEYVRVLREARPAGFIFENVASLLHPANRSAVDIVVEGARAAGYATSVQLIHSADYGIPQTRSRVFILGLRGRTTPTFPLPTHFWPSPQPVCSRRKLKPAETAGSWIGHLDRSDLFEPEEVIQGRYARHLTEIPPGWNYKALTAWAGHRKPEFVAETKYWSFLLKLSPGRPSWTLPASPGPWVGPFHWTNRRLRLPERAALQTFPPGYRFAGSPREVIRQIGNAVPCLLASKIAAHLLAAVLGAQPNRGRKLRYRHAVSEPGEMMAVEHKGPRW
jgi:DNA (cytosine-5)-methyltransferase 1